METFIYQRHRKSCAVSCLKMALCHYNKNKAYKYIEETPSSLSIKELISLASKYGLTLKAYKAISPIELKSNKTYPLLLVINENELVHMVYLYKKRGRRFYIFDPSKGKRRLSYEDLSKIWSLAYLEVINAAKCPIKPKIEPLENRGDSIVEIILGILGLVSLFVGFYFVNENGNFLVPLLSFALFSLIQIIRRIHLVKAMKRFDKKHSSSLDALPPYRREEPYRHYLNLKTIIFHKTPSIPITLVEILGLGTIFSLNDFGIGVSIALYFLVILLLELISKNKVDSLVEKLELDEARFLGGPVRKENRVKASSLLEQGYRLADIVSYKDYVYFALGLALSLLCALFSEHISLNYVLFSFMSIYLLGEEWRKLLKGLYLQDEFDKEEAYLRGLKDQEKGNIG